MNVIIAMAVLMAAPASGTEAGGLEWKVAKAWEVQPDRPMRAGTFHLPAAKGDKEPAELAIFYFGEGQGGAVDANIQRWIGQFEQPDGSDSAKKAKTSKQKVGGLDVTTVELTGTYQSGGMMMGPKVAKPGYRLLGAIVEGPKGPVFFKLTGPDKTVAGSKGAFDKMLKSIKVKKQ